MLRQLGRYSITERIASGGQATVYRAKDTVLDRTVALKVMHSNEGEYLEALRREASLVARLDHPNIATVHDFQIEDDTAYVVMEYIPGSLGEYLKDGTPLEIGNAVEIASRVCDALVYAHKSGVVHRDIKPHNILLTSDGTVKVADFGIARAMAFSTLSRQTGGVGTALYMSIEQWEGSPVDGRADLYSLGIVLYEMLTGQVPFNGEGLGEVFIKHRDIEAPPMPGDLKIPPELEAAVRRAMEKRPSDRYQTATEMLSCLAKSTGPGPGHEIADEPKAVRHAHILPFVAYAMYLSLLVLSLLVVDADLVLGISAVAVCLGGVGLTAVLTLDRRSWVNARWWAAAGVIGVVSALIGGLAAGVASSSEVAVEASSGNVTVQVLPGQQVQLVSPDGAVVVDVPANAFGRQGDLRYAPLSFGDLPELPAGYEILATAFDLTVADPSQPSQRLALRSPITLTVRLTEDDRARAEKAGGTIVLLHYRDGGIEWLPRITAVDFETMTAAAKVGGLNLFALATEVEEAEQPQAVVPTPSPTVAALPTPVPTPDRTPAAPEPTATAIASPVRQERGSSIEAFTVQPPNGSALTSGNTLSVVATLRYTLDQEGVGLIVLLYQVQERLWRPFGEAEVTSKSGQVPVVGSFVVPEMDSTKVMAILTGMDRRPLVEVELASYTIRRPVLGGPSPTPTPVAASTSGSIPTPVAAATATPTATATP